MFVINISLNIYVQKNQIKELLFLICRSLELEELLEDIEEEDY